MPADRCKVALELYGHTQFYQRDREEKNPTTGSYYSQPYFSIDPPHLVMSEAVARVLVQKLRNEFRAHPWIVNLSDGRRIDVEEPTQQPGFGDSRQPVMATIDDENSPEARWYRVIPVNRPDGGPMWCLKCTPPGFAEPQLMFAKEPLGCLQRANDIGLLPWGERVEATKPKQEVQAAPAAGWIRPGDRH